MRAEGDIKVVQDSLHNATVRATMNVATRSRVSLTFPELAGLQARVSDPPLDGADEKDAASSPASRWTRAKAALFQQMDGAAMSSSVSRFSSSPRLRASSDPAARQAAWRALWRLLLSELQKNASSVDSLDAESNRADDATRQRVCHVDHTTTAAVRP